MPTKVASTSITPITHRKSTDSGSSAMGRMERLFDRGSLQLLRTRVTAQHTGRTEYEGDGVVTGIGTVDGRPVACYSQDARISGGSFGETQAAAIMRLLGIAREARVPVVSFLESSGARIQEGVAALVGYGRVFNEIVALSRVIPQISIVAGPCAGGSAYAASLTDFVIMTRSSALFLTGPRIVSEICGEEVSITELGGSRIHHENGVCQLVVNNESEAAAQARRLLSYLPHKSGRDFQVTIDDTPEMLDPGALLPSRPSAGYDVRNIIVALTDREEFLELDARWARNLVTGFARIGGHALGIVANQPKFIGGVIDTHASDKAARFVDLCNAYALPLVVLVDTPGFMPGTRQEGDGIIRRGAAIVRAFAAARIPRFTVVLRKAYGGAFIAMNSAQLGAALVYAWPEAEIGVMDPYSAVRLTHRTALAESSEPEELLRSLTSEYRRHHCSVLGAALRGFVDEVIAPAQTRARLRLALIAFAEGAGSTSGSASAPSDIASLGTQPKQVEVPTPELL